MNEDKGNSKQAHGSDQTTLEQELSMNVSEGDVMFERRPEGTFAHFARPYTPFARFEFPRPIEAGQTVYLRIKFRDIENDVVIQNVEILSSRRFRGTLAGFEDDGMAVYLDGPTPGELTIGQIIEFDEENVFK